MFADVLMLPVRCGWDPVKPAGCEVAGDRSLLRRQQTVILSDARVPLLRDEGESKAAEKSDVETVACHVHCDHGVCLRR